MTENSFSVQPATGAYDRAATHHTARRAGAEPR
jgi:hypothetical protein